MATLTFTPQPRRLMLSACLALQAAVLATGISEFVMTTPNIAITRRAMAQSQSLEAAENAVVYIETNRGQGSGVIVDSDGLIVTNAHVVEGARQVTVTLRGRSVEAEVVAIGHRDCLDLALLRVAHHANLPTIPLGDMARVSKAQEVFAIGYPGAVQSTSATITRGIVSNLHARSGAIQFDGSINGGNSGGAVVNSHGELLGIATSKLVGTNGNQLDGISFAVAVDKVVSFIESYRRGDPALIGQAILPGNNPDSGRLVQSLTLDGQVISGVLQPGDSTFCGDSTLADIYAFEAEAGQSVMLDLVGQDMGVDLVLVSPSGQAIAVARRESRNQAAIVLEKLPETGTYSVIAKANQRDRDGRYQLRATEPILVEQGVLHGRSRTCSDSGHRCQTYAFEGRPNQTVTVILHRAEFAPYIALLDASGQRITTGQSGEAFVNFTLPAAGWYTLVVSNTDPAASGQFTVSVHDTETLAIPREVSQR